MDEIYNPFVKDKIIHILEKYDYDSYKTDIFKDDTIQCNEFDEKEFTVTKINKNKSKITLEFIPTDKEKETKKLTIKRYQLSPKKFIM